MPRASLFFYSPFNPQNITEGRNCSLLLQFILSEILVALTAKTQMDPLEFVFSSPACFFPFDWSYETGCLNKIHEHSQLLGSAFPHLAKEVELFDFHLNHLITIVAQCKKAAKELPFDLLKEHLKKIFLLLERFIQECRESESLILFLLEHQKEIETFEDLQKLLLRIFPEGLDHSRTLLMQNHAKRGFTSLLPDIERLYAQWQ